jgi:long-chain acyl-CoA synthetase
MSSTKQYPLPLERFYHWEATAGQRVFLRQPFPGKGYVDFTFAETGRQVRAIAAALKARNLPPGSHIGILSKNCAHWIMADLAIWMAGHVSIPLYPNLAEASVRNILVHADCRLAFIGKLDDLGAYVRGVPDGVPCIAFPYHEVPNAERWDDLVARTPPMKENPTRSMTELATIVYTSGTTGEPKGVMHRFSSFAISGTEIQEVVGLSENDRFFSYLPLAHVAERILIETCALYAGASIAFAESLDTFQKNLQTIRPTIFLSVPRLWQKFQSGILAKVPQKKLSLLLKIPIVSWLIKRKLRAALGLSDARIVLTGAAPTPTPLMEWFDKIGIRIQEAYGMTENFAYSHYNRTGAVETGTVGQPWPHVRTRIAADGEIQIATPCDFIGYYKSGDRSEHFDGDFLKTGDRGEIGPRGHLKITGRTKDLFKTSKGKYVAPSPIETKFGAYPYFEAICVVGANLSTPMVLAVLHPEVKARPRADLARDLSACVEAVNSKLDHHEQLSKLIVVNDPWTVESGLVTPSMKVKRGEVEAKYGGRLNAWGDAKETVLWEG